MVTPLLVILALSVASVSCLWPPMPESLKQMSEHSSGRTNPTGIVFNPTDPGPCGIPSGPQRVPDECRCKGNLTGELLESDSTSVTFVFDLRALEAATLEKAELSFAIIAYENFALTCHYDVGATSIDCWPVGMRTRSSRTSSHCHQENVTPWLHMRFDRQLQLTVPVCGLAQDSCNVKVTSVPLLSLDVSYYGNNNFHCEMPSTCIPQIVSS